MTPPVSLLEILKFFHNKPGLDSLFPEIRSDELSLCEIRVFQPPRSINLLPFKIKIFNLTIQHVYLFHPNPTQADYFHFEPSPHGCGNQC